MAAYSAGAWTEKTVNGLLIMECTIAQGNTDDGSASVITPESLDPNKSWNLIVNADNTTLDGGTTTTASIDICFSREASLLIVGGTPTYTRVDSAIMASACMANVIDGHGSVVVDPNQTVATVADAIVKSAPAPGYIIWTLSDSTQTVADNRIVIIQ